MKKIILTLGFFALVSISQTITASTSHTSGVYQAGDEYDEKVKTATEKLGLSKDQQVKFKDYLKKKDAEKKQLMAKEYATPEEKKAAQQKFKDKYNAELKKILTAEQVKKMESK